MLEPGSREFVLILNRMAGSILIHKLPPRERALPYRHKLKTRSKALGGIDLGRANLRASRCTAVETEASETAICRARIKRRCHLVPIPADGIASERLLNLRRDRKAA